MTFDKLIKRINKKIDKCISNGDKSLYLEIKVSTWNISLNDFICVYHSLHSPYIGQFDIMETDDKEVWDIYEAGFESIASLND